MGKWLTLILELNLGMLSQFWQHSLTYYLLCLEEEVHELETASDEHQRVLESGDVLVFCTLVRIVLTKVPVEYDDVEGYDTNTTPLQLATELSTYSVVDISNQTLGVKHTLAAIRHCVDREESRLQDDIDVVIEANYSKLMSRKKQFGGVRKDSNG